MSAATTSGTGSGVSSRSRSRALLGTATVAALGGFLFGYDTGVIGAALLYLKPAFGLSRLLEQVVVASLLLGAIVGVLVGGVVVDAVGRRRTLQAAAAVFATGALVCAVAPGVSVLVLARFVLGTAIGTSSVVVPGYIAEIAPRETRGRLVSMNQLMITVGILVSYLVGYAFAPVQGWRWMLGLAAVPAVVMLLGLLRLTESPRWLLARGREEEARAALARTRGPAEVDEEVRDIQAQAEAEQQLSYRDLLRPALRPALVLGVAVAATNQLVGVNAVIYYAPTILEQAGFGSSAAILASVGIGAINVLVTVVALLLVDRVGRRPLLLGGIVAVVAALLFLGALYLLPDQQGLTGVLLVVGLCVYIAAFAGSLGLAIWLVNSEVFPTAVRGKAAACGTVTHWTLDFAISLSVLTTISLLTPTGLFWLYAGFGVIGLFVLARRLPETKGRSLEDIERSLREQGGVGEVDLRPRGAVPSRG
ncbi:MAG: sugar porter family MFS transporter [Motilibacteraceae bacterium]